MSDTWRENAIVEAIEIIADRKIAQASFDKTIKGIVNKLLDKTSGKYEIKYQDSLFEASATSSDIYYDEGQEVSILIPGNDWDRVKTIIGGVNNNATTYNQIQQAHQLYNQIGPNVVSGRVELCSYRYQFRDLYRQGQLDNQIEIDQERAKQYIQQGDGLALGMNVQTRLDSSQVGGNYGLIFNLRFLNSVNGQPVIRPYVISAKDVIGNPYALIKETSVEKLFSQDVDVENFDGVESVQVFCEGFLEAEGKPNDIFITNIRLNGADVLSEQDLKGYIVHIDCSETGNILNEQIDSITLKAELKIGGKICSDKLYYYWFRENGTIFRGSDKYSSYGGDGWECLNNFNNNLAVPEISNTIYFTLGNGSQYPLTIQSVQRKTNIKCVIVGQQSAINESGLGEVFNRTILTNIQIDSSDKKQGSNQNKVDYYLDAGLPTLTCIIDDQKDPVEGYSYTWTVVPARGKASLKESDQEFNQNYLQKKTAYQNNILQKQKMAPADMKIYQETDEYQQVKQAFEGVKDKERIEGNVYYNFPISSISNYSKVICTVKDQQNKYKGSASITLYNHMQVKGSYNLNIQQGTQVFQYDGKGNSPTSPQLEKPIQIKPLRLALVDNEGQQISYEQIITNGYVEWLFPKYNTLLVSNKEKNGEPLDTITLTGTDIALAADYDIYKNIPAFYYSIENTYDSKKTNNDIRVDVKYKDLLFTTYTDFTFPKDGDPGTNGTDYIVKLTPSTSTDRIYVSNKFPTFVFDNDGSEVDKLNFQVYNNSRKIQGQDATIWYCPPKSFTSSYVNCDNGVVTGRSIYQDSVQTDCPIDIIRAQYNLGDLKYYAEYPVCYNYLNNISGDNYRFKVKPKTGFKYAVYAEDGTSPNYDNTLPFEIVVEKQDQRTGYYYIIDSGLQYSWSTISNYLIQDEQRNIQLPSYQKYFKPSDKFPGDDLTTAIVVRIYQNQNYLGYLHIPVYMIINRYGHSALNDWDGNSIDLGKNGETILAPQVGAGKKDPSNNTFTGLLMGDVKSDNKVQTGLFGYHNGQRSIFLDAQTGNTILGKQGEGQIKLVPDGTSTIANWKINQNTLQGGNVILNKDGYIDVNYSTTTNPKTGVRIDGRTSADKVIDTGSGNFSVTRENGYLTAKGGGSIASWNIKDDRLTSENNTITLLASNGSIYSGNHSSLGANNSGYYIGSDGISLGNTSGYIKFRVTSNGDLTTNSGQIGPWNIGNKQLTNGTVGLGTKSFDGSNSFSPGSTITTRFWGTDSTGDLNFAIDTVGKLYSKSGKIGGWNITNNRLYSSSGTNGINLYSDGNISSANYSASNGTGYSIGWNGTANFYNINAKGGTIGNYTISGGQLSNGNVTLTSDGKLQASLGHLGNVSIDSTGIHGTGFDITGSHAQFTGLVVNSNGVSSGGSGGISGGSSGGSWNLGSGKASMGDCDVGKNFTVDQEDNKTYIENLVVGKITADYLKTAIADIVSLEVKAIDCENSIRCANIYIDGHWGTGATINVPKTATVNLTTGVVTFNTFDSYTFNEGILIS